MTNKLLALGTGIPLSPPEGFKGFGKLGLESNSAE